MGWESLQSPCHLPHHSGNPFSLHKPRMSGLGRVQPVFYYVMHLSVVSDYYPPQDTDMQKARSSRLNTAGLKFFGDCTLIKDCLRGWEGGDGDEDFGVSVVSCADLGVGGGSGVVGGEVALG